MKELKITTINLPGGTIRAVLEDDLIRARGVRYATAKRFGRPLPVQPWDGSEDCSQPAVICPQHVPSRLDGVTGPLARDWPQDEDCLHVTVTTTMQQLSDHRKSPVMVFFHGGAYLSGGSDLDCYEPSQLVREGRVVVVNVSHRLGLFGYLPIADMSPANLGLLDQIAALTWTQNNIGAFGGDKNNVTLFGQSAGADSIMCLMAAEGTQALFHRTILQSAPAGKRFSDRDQMIAHLSDLAKKKLGTEAATKTTSEILALQLELLVAAKKFAAGAMTFAPTTGHAPLPALPELRERVLQVATRKPLLIGWTKDEGKAFVPLNDTLRPFTDAPLVGSYLRSMFAWALGATIFTWPGQRLHREYLNAGGQSSWYQFNWCPSQGQLGASHCIDLPFILGSWKSWSEAPMLGGVESKPIVEKLGAELRCIWSAFARGDARIVEGFTIDAHTLARSVIL